MGDTNLTFKQHIEQLVLQPKIKRGFSYRNKACVCLVRKNYCTVNRHDRTQFHLFIYLQCVSVSRPFKQENPIYLNKKLEKQCFVFVFYFSFSIICACHILMSSKANHNTESYFEECFNLI